MRLAANEIAFINNYLKNSGVEYMDIRYEMTDHVATALEDKEGDFYDNFKEYMVKHKEQLLESSKKFSRIARDKAITQLFVNMVSRKGIILFGAAFSIFSIMTAYFEQEMKDVFSRIGIDHHTYVTTLNKEGVRVVKR